MKAEKRINYSAAMEADNRALERAGMPYRYDDAGYARCVECGEYYFRADRAPLKLPDCPHYDSFHEAPFAIAKAEGTE